MEEIKKGDRVKYIDTRYNKVTRKTEKVAIFGTWDGEKVICEDDEKTTVRKKEWLTKVNDTIS